MLGLLSLSCVQGFITTQYTCCGPDDVWEADEGFMFGSNAGGGSMTQGAGRLSYNNTAQKVNMVVEEWTDGVAKKYRILQDFLQKKQYTVINGVCYPTTITYDFIPSCVPANATKVTSSFYGTPDRPFKVEVYKTKLLNLDAYVSVNPDPTDNKVCLPIAEVLYGQTKMEGKLVGVMENFGFTNYSKGTKDPHVFDVPPECNKATEQADVKINRLRRSVFA